MTVAPHPSRPTDTTSEQAPRKAPSPRGRQLALTDLYVLIVLAIVLVGGLTSSVVPNDFWFHMATGRVVADTGAIPTHDAFSFTHTGEAFFNQSWLAQLFFYWGHRLGGVELLLLIHALALVVAFWLLLRLCRQLGASKRVAALTVGLVALPLSFTNFGVRPQTYAVPLFALTLWAVWGSRHRALQGAPHTSGGRLWIVPVVVLVWVNLHGSFPLALAIVAAAVVGDLVARRLGLPAPTVLFDRRLALVGLCAALATLINPGGWQVWRYVVELSRNPVIAELVTEWSAPSLRDLTGMGFFLALILVGAALVTARRRLDPAEGFLLAGFVLLSGSAVRNVVWFAFVAAVVLSRLAAGPLPDRPVTDQGSRTLNWGFAVALSLLVLLALPWVRPHVLPERFAPILARHTPVMASAELAALETPPRRLFHELGYGSYLIWAVPDQPVFVDPRIELYPPQLWDDYLALSRGYDVDKLVARHGIDGVLADVHLQAGLVAVLRDHDGWTVAFEDRTSVLFIRARKDAPDA